MKGTAKRPCQCNGFDYNYDMSHLRVGIGDIRMVGVVMIMAMGEQIAGCVDGKGMADGQNDNVKTTERYHD
jgi:hypothetical protein